MLSVDDVLDILAIDIVGIIPEDEQILVGSNQGLPVAMSGMNGQSASQAFNNLAQRVQGDTIPFIDLTPKSGFMDRFRSWVGGR